MSFNEPLDKCQKICESMDGCLYFATGNCALYNNKCVVKYDPNYGDSTMYRLETQQEKKDDEEFKKDEEKITSENKRISVLELQMKELAKKYNDLLELVHP